MVCFVLILDLPLDWEFQRPFQCLSGLERFLEVINNFLVFHLLNSFTETTDASFSNWSLSSPFYFLNLFLYFLKSFLNFIFKPIKLFHFVTHTFWHFFIFKAILEDYFLGVFCLCPALTFKRLAPPAGVASFSYQGR